MEPGKGSLLLKVVGAAIAVALVGAACSSPQSAGDASSDPTQMAEASANDAATEATVDSPAAELNQSLTYLLTEHEYLAGIAVAMGVTHGLDSGEFEAAAGALDENSQDLADAVGSVYGEAGGDQFLELWRAHIGFFVDYTEGVATGNERKATKARKALDGYREDFGAFIESATEGGLPKDAVAEALDPHVKRTIAAIDAVLGERGGNPFSLLKKAAEHMPHISTALAGAITAQFPEKF